MGANRKIEYRFVFTNGTQTRVVYPRYDKGLNLQTEPEVDEYFYRTKCSYEFKFTRSDYDLIYNSDINVDYFLTLQKRDKPQSIQVPPPGAPGSWMDHWKGVFNRTDCFFDEDRSIVSVKCRNNDQYESIYNNWEREFDLIELGVPSEDVTFYKRGVIQLYEVGSSVLTNIYVNGNYNEQVVNLFPGSIELTDVHHFSDFNLLNKKIFIGGNGEANPSVGGSYTTPDGFIAPSNGTYTIDAVSNASRAFICTNVILDDFDDIGSIWQVNGVNFILRGVIITFGESRVYMDQEGGSNSSPTSGTLTHVSGGVNIGDITFQSTTTDFYFVRSIIRPSNGTNTLFIGPSNYYWLDNPFFEMRSLTNGTKCSFNSANVQARILTNLPSINGQPTLVLPAEDIIESGYQYALKPDQFTNFEFSNGHSVSPTYFGKYNSDSPNFAGEYYVKPTNVDRPLRKSTWKGSSLWFSFSSNVSGLANSATEESAAQSFKLSDVLSIILGEFTTSTFLPNEEHSFLYRDVNPISGDTFSDIYITPKSNILKFGYDSSASKVLIKLKDLFSSLKDVFHSGWHIDEEDRFRFEHKLFYHNGGQYGGPLLSTDLTSLINPKNQKTWSFGTNKYSFLKRNVPSRTTFEWMDESSELFKGVDIIQTDVWIDKSQIKPINIPIMSTDIDLMIANPSGFSNNGFVLMNVESLGLTNQVKFKWLNFKGISMNVQNGQLSFTYLHDKFFKSPTLSPRTTINGVDFFSGVVDRNRQQELEFPSTDVIDPIQLIRSTQGDGKLASITENILTSEIKMKLNHDT